MIDQGELRSLEEEKKTLAEADDFVGADRIRKKIQKLKESDPKDHKPTFRVQLIGGKGFIVNGDSSGSEFYCVLTLGKTKLKSQSKKKTLAPEWNESFVFDVDAKGLPPKMRLDVYDHKVRVLVVVVELC